MEKGKYGKLTIKGSSPDGNIFAIMARVYEMMDAQGATKDEVADMKFNIMTSHSYGEALKSIEEFVIVEII